MTKDFTNLDLWSIDWIQLEKFFFHFRLSTEIFIKKWLIESQQHLYLCLTWDNSRRITNWIIQMVAR